MIRKKHNTEAGFTLLELMVVVGVLALITSLSTQYTVKETHRQRKAATVKRLHQIRYAIAGDPSRTLNNRPAFSGYIADTGLAPLYVRDLLSNRYCTTPGLNSREACEAQGFEWREAENWKGPYLDATGTKDIRDADGAIMATIPVFRDGWGNRSRPKAQIGSNTETLSENKAEDPDNLYFGWDFTITASGDIRITSPGLNGTDQDDPGSRDYQYEKDLDTVITADQIRGTDTEVSVENRSGKPVGLFCLKARYRDGSTALVDLAVNRMVPAPECFGDVVISGLAKASAKEACDTASTYAGIEEVHHFSHNLFNTGRMSLAIQ